MNDAPGGKFGAIPNRAGTGANAPAARPRAIVTRTPVQIPARSRPNPGLRPSPFTGSFPPLELGAENRSVRQDDGRLWAIALAASLLGNVIIFGLAGLASLDSQKLRQRLEAAAAAQP
ncbi:MAG: hypothetical protein EON93_21395, partial [Burkholderiales bacterium]